MRKSDENRKLFNTAHYEIIAKRFREALEPRFNFAGQTAGNLSATSALVGLAKDMAKRFQADNDQFDPQRFLNRCSPDPEQYPLAELWDDSIEAPNAKVSS